MMLLTTHAVLLLSTLFVDAAQVSLSHPKFPWISKFASVGDSYSAGLGSGDRLDWSCSRYAASYPNILHTSLLGEDAHRTHQFLSCSGATTHEILHKQIPNLSANLDLLTISAGGNDIGLTPILSDCVYQFYFAGEDACQNSMHAARDRIANDSQLYANVTALIAAAQPKMHPHHGIIYYTGYATFFGAADAICDHVTWAVWKDVEWTKQYLTLAMRIELNALVRAVNAVIAKAVAAAGPGVRFVDYDARIEAASGRYCEARVQEPDPNRSALAFYEWDTVDQGEKRTARLNETGEGVPRGSFESGIAERIGRTLREHPGWRFEEGKGFVNGTVVVEVDGRIGDAIHWLIPDSYKRVFHLRPSGHRVIAEMVLEDLQRRGGRERGVEL